MYKKDLTGLRFGKLTALRYVGVHKYGSSLWLCKCDCGKEKIITSSNLMSGRSHSCGCLRSELAKVNLSTHKHGLNRTRIYSIWCGMKRRCYRESHEHYKDYGGRGITVCDKWQAFEGFLEDMWESYEENLTLDRIDVNGNYEKDNCRWATQKQQLNNRRTSIKFCIDGICATLSEHCERLGMKYMSAYNRIYRKGWDIEKALKTPIDEKYVHNR